MQDTNLDYYQIIIVMVITCSTSGAGSCERARACNVAVELSSTAQSDPAPSVSRSAVAQRGFCSPIDVTDMVSSGDLQGHYISVCTCSSSNSKAE
jgi:hypothetical protein